MDQDPKRERLNSLLATITPNVYFQPPANVQMKYPCIVYTYDDSDTKFADNKPYNRHKRYQVIVIDINPDTAIKDRVEDLPLCGFDRSYIVDNLNHYVYNLFF